MKKNLATFSKKVSISFALFFLLPSLTLAQDLTRSVDTVRSGPIIPSTYLGYALVGFRILLGVLFLISGMVAFKAGFNWLYWEGNALKAHNAKTTLAKALFFITILFVIASLFRWWLGGDYSSLVI